jgi:cadmium resistance transport/sequestration family protein
MLLTIATAFIAFASTNLDDIVLLMIFFSQTNGNFRQRHVVAGQYLGIGILVVVSLLGFAGAAVLPPNLIRLLGLIPLAIGLYRLFRQYTGKYDDPIESEAVHVQPAHGWLGGLLNPYMLGVTGVTVANGADNISVYIPLFANQTLPDVLLTIIVFGILVAVWCYAGYRVARYPSVAHFLERYGERLVPYVFILLGLYILLEG